MSGAARSQRGGRRWEHSDRGWADEEKACGREQAYRGGHEVCTPGDRNGLRQRGATVRGESELCCLILAAAATEYVRHTLLTPTYPQTQEPLTDVLSSQHGGTDTAHRFTHTCAQDTQTPSHTDTRADTDNTCTLISNHPPICVHVQPRETHSNVLSPMAAHVPADPHTYSPANTHTCAPIQTHGHRGTCMSHPHIRQSVCGHSGDHVPGTKAGVQGRHVD